jgi:hypothetical protein
MRSCCANCWRTLIRRATSERPCAGSNGSLTSGCRHSPRSHLPRQHSPNFDTATEELASRSLSVCFIVARLRRVARPRTATTFGCVRLRHSANCASPKCPGINLRNRRTVRRVAAHLPTTRRFCTRIRRDAEGGEGGVTTSGEKPRVLGVAKVKARTDAAEKPGNCGRQDKP